MVISNYEPQILHEMKLFSKLLASVIWEDHDQIHPADRREKRDKKQGGAGVEAWNAPTVENVEEMDVCANPRATRTLTPLMRYRSVFLALKNAVIIPTSVAPSLRESKSQRTCWSPPVVPVMKKVAESSGRLLHGESNLTFLFRLDISPLTAVLKEERCGKTAEGSNC